MKKIALITGASSGIGKATALKLAEAGFDLILSGRNRKRLEEIEKEVESQFETKVITRRFDVTIYQEVVDTLQITLPKEWHNIEVLINCAGIALNFSPIHEGVVEDWDKMIDTNIKGLLYVTRVIVLGMVKRKQGHIINIGSILSRHTLPNYNVYSATKCAVDGLTKCMRLELQPYGIQVTQILPGRIKTAFALNLFDGNKQQADSSYAEFTPLNAEDVADAILYSLLQPTHVNIQDIFIASTKQK